MDTKTYAKIGLEANWESKIQVIVISSLLKALKVKSGKRSWYYDNILWKAIIRLRNKGRKYKK